MSIGLAIRIMSMSFPEHIARLRLLVNAIYKENKLSSDFQHDHSIGITTRWGFCVLPGTMDDKLLIQRYRVVHDKIILHMEVRLRVNIKEKTFMGLIGAKMFENGRQVYKKDTLLDIYEEQQQSVNWIRCKFGLPITLHRHILQYMDPLGY